MNADTKTIVIRIISLVMVLSTIVTIFAFSSQPAEQSRNVSKKVTELVEQSKLNNVLPEKKDDKVMYIRKYAHVILYGLLGMSSSVFAMTFAGSMWLKALTAAGFCAVYSASDELHQKFVDGRSCELRDLLIDAAGYAAGIAFAAAVYYIIKSFRRNSI